MIKSKPIVSLISSLSENKVIGKNNDLIFKVADDLNRFRRITKGHPIIMGKNTFLSIGRSLPDRPNIVITSDTGFKRDGAIIVSSLGNAIEKAKSFGSKEIFIIGGGRVFADAIGMADKLYLTLFHKQVDGDVFFPDYSDFKKVVFREEKQEGDLKYEFIDLTR